MNCPKGGECNRWQGQISRCFYYGKIDPVDVLLILTSGCDRFRVSEKGGIAHAP